MTRILILLLSSYLILGCIKKKGDIVINQGIGDLQPAELGWVEHTEYRPGYLLVVRYIDDMGIKGTDTILAVFENTLQFKLVYSDYSNELILKSDNPVLRLKRIKALTIKRRAK